MKRVGVMACFNLVFTDLPDHICPDSIYCPDQIVHLGVSRLIRVNIRRNLISNRMPKLFKEVRSFIRRPQQILFNPGFEVFQGATLEVDLEVAAKRIPDKLKLFSKSHFMPEVFCLNTDYKNAGSFMQVGFFSFFH